MTYILVRLKKFLAKSKSNKNIDQLKNYLTEIKNLVNKNDAETSGEEYNTDMPP